MRYKNLLILSRKYLVVILAAAMILVFTGSGFADAEPEPSVEKIPLTSTDIPLESGKTYTISNVEELYNFAAIVNNGSGRIGEGATVELLNDIVVNPGTFDEDGSSAHNPTYNGESITDESGIREWTLIGDVPHFFCGVFDGNNYTISGLYFDDQSWMMAGFFGYSNKLKVQNLTITNSYFRGRWCGTICGDLRQGEIFNCRSSAIVSGYSGLGGIAGRADGIIKNCKNEGKVLGGFKSGNSHSLTSDLGGICGEFSDGYIIGCSNFGQVKGDKNIGAIVGNLSEKGTVLADCVNKGFATNGELIGTDDRQAEGILVDLQAEICDSRGYSLLNSCIAFFDEAATSRINQLYGYDEKKKHIVLLPNGSLVFHIASKGDYRILSVTGDNCTVTETGINEYTLSDFKGNTKLTIICGGEQNKYTLETINNMHGFVDESGLNMLSIGADAGYYVADVIVNGKSVGAVKSLHVNEGDVIEVYFAKEGETWQETQENDKNQSSAEKPLTEAQKEKIKVGVKKTTIKLSTVNMYNRSIRIAWKKSAGYKVDYYQVFRSRKKNSGYGTKAFYTSKTGKASYYTNTKSVKKGVRYYYKVRGVRVIDGKKYYTQWSNKVSRVKR